MKINIPVQFIKYADKIFINKLTEEDMMESGIKLNACNVQFIVQITLTKYQNWSFQHQNWSWKA